MRRIAPVLGCLAVTATRKVEAKEDLEFDRQLNHFGQLISHVARRQLAGGGGVKGDEAQLALDMHHLAQLHQWLCNQHHHQHQSDFDSVLGAYQKICDFERVKLDLLRDTSSSSQNADLRHIYTAPNVDPLINTLSLVESNLTQLEHELSQKRDEVNKSLDRVKSEHFNGQLDQSQKALEQWHEEDHSVLGLVKRQNEETALNAMAQLARGEIEEMTNQLKSQFNELDKQAAAQFGSLSAVKTNQSIMGLTLNDVFFDAGIDHLDTLSRRLECKITEYNHDTTVSLTKMDAYKEHGELLYLLEQGVPSEHVLKLIIKKTRNLSSMDGSIKAILGVLERHGKDYFIEDDLRLILAPCQREAQKWAHLADDEPVIPAYVYWLTLTNNRLGNPYTLIRCRQPKTHNQSILSMLNDRPIIDIVRLLNSLTGLSRCTVQTWLDYARSHLAVLQALDALKSVLESRQFTY